MEWERKLTVGYCAILSSFYLCATLALSLFALQMTKDGRYMISDAISTEIGESSLTSASIAASLAVLIVQTVIHFAIGVQLGSLQNPFLGISGVAAVSLAFCVVCDVNKETAERSCHHASCLTGSVALALIFGWVFCTVKGWESRGRLGQLYTLIVVLGALLCIAARTVLLLALWFETDRVFGVLEMLLFFVAAVLEGFSLFYALQYGVKRCTEYELVGCLEY